MEPFSLGGFNGTFNATGTGASAADVINNLITAAATSFQAYTRSNSPFGQFQMAGGQCPPGYYLNPLGQCVPLQNFAQTTTTNLLPILLIGGLVLAVVLLRK